MWHFFKKEHKRCITRHAKLSLPAVFSIFHSTKYCKINLLKAQFWSCHHCMENISTNPHSLQNKFLNRKDGQMYLLWHNIRRHEVSTVLENNTKVDSFLNLFFYYSWQTVQISFRCTPKWLDIYTPYTVAEMPIWKLAIPSTYPMLKKLLAQLTAQSWSWAPVQSLGQSLLPCTRHCPCRRHHSTVTTRGGWRGLRLVDR